MSYDIAATALRLKTAGIDNPRLDARVLWAHACIVAPENTADLFESYIVRRSAHEPVAYITGMKEFWGMDFAVGPGVLVPRPDTETIIEAVLANFTDRAAPLRVLDLGTGTGCILSAVLSEYPAATGVAVEASEVARHYAEANFERLGLSGRVELFAGNWMTLPRADYDIVLSNPPYIRSADIATLQADVAEYEPVSALDGGPDGLCAYRSLTGRLEGWLDLRGQAFFEIGQGQENEVKAIAEAAGLRFLDVKADLAGIFRVVVLSRA